MAVSSWKDFINQEIKKSYFKNLSKFLIKESKEFFIFPKHENVLIAFKYCPLKDVDVVILGQDPYHGPNQANGLSFSVPNGQPIPPSLRNIFTEVKNDLGLDQDFKWGNLTPWARQGVLLLNTVLTVRKGEPGSHKNMGWETFTDAAISLINEQDRPIVYMLWGAYARSKKNLITNSKHLVLEAPHPSPLSAYTGFMGCRHFSKANLFLAENKALPVNWELVAY